MEILVGSLTNLSVNPTVAYTFTTTNYDVTGFALDPVTQKVYLVGYDDEAGSTGSFFDEISFSGANYSGTGTLTTLATLPATDGFIQGIALDLLHNQAFFAVNDFAFPTYGPGSGLTGFVKVTATKPTLLANAIYKASSITSASTLTQLPISGGQTDSGDGNANNIPSSDGLITSIAVDPVTETIYFSTTPYGSGANAGIYSYAIGGSGTIGTVWTQTPSTTPSTTDELNDLTVDPANGTYFVDDSYNAADSINAQNFTIFEGSLSGGTPSPFVSFESSTQQNPEGLAVDDAPVLTSSNSTVTFDQGQAAVTIDSGRPGFNLTDISVTEFPSATVSITAHLQSGDVLGIPSADLTSGKVTGTNITPSYNSSTGVLTLSGLDTAADYEKALSEVTFSDTATTPSVSARTITFAVSDGLLSGTATDTVDVHDQPVVTAAGTVTFDGGGSAVLLDSGLTVTDLSSTTLASATVSIGSGFLSGDTLSVGTAGGLTVSYNASDGVLTLTGTASLTTYQTALELVSYSFTSGGDPTGGGSDTSRTIDWVVNDGTLSSTTATSTLDTVHVAPTVTPSGGTPTFDGGGAAVTVNSGLTVGDVDSGGDLTGATVTISSGYLTGDTLAVASSVLSGTGITATFSATNHDLVLSGTDTLAHYQSVLDAVTYSFATPGDPTGGGTDTTRTISWVVTDASTSNGTSTAKTSTVDTVHEAPTVTAGAAVNYNVGGSAALLDSALTVSDVDSGGNLTGATVTIGSGFVTGDDTLSFSTQNGITGSYAAGVLTLSGTTTLANYQTALELITFSTTAATGGARTIDWVVKDGSTSNGTSTTATSTVEVVAGPQISGTGNSVNYDENGAAVAVDSGLTLTDPAGANITSATVTISSGYVSGDLLAIPAGDISGGKFESTNITVTSFNTTTDQLVLSGTDTAANYQAALDAITYSFTANPTTAGTSRTLTYSATDANSTTSAAGVTSTVELIHVAPVVTAGTPSVTFDGGSTTPVVLDSGITVADFGQRRHAGERDGVDQLRLHHWRHPELHQQFVDHGQHRHQHQFRRSAGADFGWRHGDAGAVGRGAAIGVLQLHAERRRSDRRLRQRYQPHDQLGGQRRIDQQRHEQYSDHDALGGA